MLMSNAALILLAHAQLGVFQRMFLRLLLAALAAQPGRCWVFRSCNNFGQLPGWCIISVGVGFCALLQLFLKSITQLCAQHHL